MDHVLPGLRADVQFSRFAHEGVLYDAPRGLVHALNGTATFIAEHCDGHCTRDVLVAEMARTYSDVDAAALAEDIERTLHSFKELGLVAEA
ncbi:MAG: HPr-rel-A system PqqD family peptide chaperone [Candidatus Hydrogenedentes bacterium]|nr:HPr-rel-A system PqqD family peptide chaperone [Candidatus Hydrogenedentota bacterium]